MQEKTHDFLQYLLELHVYGWQEYLSDKEWIFITTSILYLSTLSGGKEPKLIDEKYYYLDFKPSTQYREFGINSNTTLSIMLRRLDSIGLIVYEQGNAGTGGSRVMFPIETPMPPEIKVPAFYQRRFKNETNFIELKREKRLALINGKTDKDYSKETINDYKISESADKRKFHTVRRKLQAQWLILSAKFGINVNDKEIQLEEREKLNALYKLAKNPYIVEDFIHRLYFGNEQIEDLYVTAESLVEATLEVNEKPSKIDRKENTMEDLSLFKKYLNNRIKEEDKTEEEIINEEIENFIQDNTSKIFTYLTLRKNKLKQAN